MSKKFLLFIALISLVLVSFAQTGKIAGKVLNNKNEPLPGVSVKITGSQGGTTTDVDGLFTLNLQAGKKYQLVLSAVGYDPKTIDDVEVTAGQVLDQIFILENSGKSLNTVTVTANRRSGVKETTASLIQFQKNTNTVASVISAESIRRSPDKNTGEVLKRIPGSSIIDGKYLVVRGLSDRYNMAMLNGVQLSSTEPDRKTFSFDIFPAAMLDNIIINKAFVPEMSGEWAGGLIQINTRDIPSKNFFNIQVGTGFNTQTIGQDFYTYKGGDLDFIGIDDGARALPSGMPAKSAFRGNTLSEAEKAQWGSKFPNIWTASKGSAPLNMSLQASGGFSGTLFDKKIGGVFALTYANNAKRLAFDNNVYNVTLVPGNPLKQADSSYQYNNIKYSREVLWGAMANLAVQLNNNHKISVKNIFNINSTDYTTQRTGYDYEFFAPIRATELSFKNNTLFNTQLTGDHNFSAISSKLKWYGSFSILDQYIPFQRRIQYNQESNGDWQLLMSASNSQRSGSIFYSNLSDYLYNAGSDWSTTFKLFDNVQTVKGGYLFQVKDRLYNARPFSIVLPPGSNNALKGLPADQVFAPENFGGNGFGFEEYSEKNFRYLANSILNAGYLQMDNQFNDWLRVVWGVRIEDFDQLVGSVDPKDTRHVNTRVTDWLPAVNATFKLNNLTNIRLSASQTIVRPEFRELSNLAFYDFELGASVVGNPNLKRTKITNLDLRYELYPRSGEVFTVGVFYKQFEDPIEQMFNQTGAGSSNAFNFINAQKAKNYGAEIEVRKKLDFINGFKNFTIQSNIAYIYSRVTGEKGAKLDRPLQGQSPYVANVSLQYDQEQSGWSATLLFNQIGRRILYVGNDEMPGIWEAPRPLLDLQVSKKVLDKKGEIRLNVSDILNQRAYFYQNLNDNEGFKKGNPEDVISIKRNYGTNVSLTFGYNF
ncbi:TonB-dependent receptor [Pseudobacter ginsenosidimutans]|uniref:TonB-dependent receptor n=1 Tax=Pseudobacter ginsenosidimutans TaxID=661488 RepID=A0A4Q7MUN8_9BACT|nr:TonB-dependent receptor [Pseudobacter ginsenosidimutans]QEC40898.1 TonB-dependent receptor [Pseudobacter ginsenosidimutans]RZS72367.1 TonB-dependent receptor [Pseudobacter ginsenosidimutans]